MSASVGFFRAMKYQGSTPLSRSRSGQWRLSRYFFGSGTVFGRWVCLLVGLVSDGFNTFNPSGSWVPGRESCGAWEAEE